MLVVGTFSSYAQNFTVVSTYNKPAEGETFSVTNLTNNLGLMYRVSDNCSVGLVKNGEEYDLLSRYNYNKNIFISAQTSFENTFDSLNVGVGYSLPVFWGVNVEPNYTFNLSDFSNSWNNGSWSLGFSYNF